MMVFILLQCRNVGKMGGKPDYSSDVRVYRKYISMKVPQNRKELYIM